MVKEMVMERFVDIQAGSEKMGVGQGISESSIDKVVPFHIPTL